MGLLFYFGTPLALTSITLFFGMFVGMGLQGHLMDLRLPATLGWMNVPFLLLHLWQPYGSLLAGFAFLSLLFVPWPSQTRPAFFKAARAIFGTIQTPEMEQITKNTLEKIFKTFNPKHTPASLRIVIEASPEPKLHDFSPNPPGKYKDVPTFFGTHNNEKEMSKLVLLTQQQFKRQFGCKMLDFSQLDVSKTETAHQAIQRQISNSQ